MTILTIYMIIYIHMSLYWMIDSHWMCMCRLCRHVLDFYCCFQTMMDTTYDSKLTPLKTYLEPLKADAFACSTCVQWQGKSDHPRQRYGMIMVVSCCFHVVSISRMAISGYLSINHQAIYGPYGSSQLIPTWLLKCATTLSRMRRWPPSEKAFMRCDETRRRSQRLQGSLAQDEATISDVCLEIGRWVAAGGKSLMVESDCRLAMWYDVYKLNGWVRSFCVILGDRMQRTLVTVREWIYLLDLAIFLVYQLHLSKVANRV